MIRTISKNSHLSEATIRAVLDALADHLVATISKGESSVYIPGIGTLTVVDRCGRTYNDPAHPGHTLNSADHSVLRYRPAPDLIRRLNASSATRLFRVPKR